MKLKLKTAEFQNMVARAIKGASCNSNLAITQMMAIELTDNKLTLTTTDNSNYLYVSKDKVVGDNFYAVVYMDKFSKLISKLTCDEMTIEVNRDSKKDLDTLVIHGNGKYIIELPYDEDGELVEFPDPLGTEDEPEFIEADTKLSLIKLMLSTAKPSLMTGTKVPQYTGYYVGKNIVATDTYKICSIDVEMLEEPVIIPAEYLDLLEAMEYEDVHIKYNAEEGIIIFSTPDVTVYGHSLEGIEDYKIDAILSVVEQPYPSSCKIEKSALMQMLERLSLFVDTYDKNSVYLTFTKDGMEISNKRDKGSEIIPYKESVDFAPFTCCIDINLFRTQVKAYQSEIIEVLYGQEGRIKFVDGNVRQIIALADDDRFEEGEDE